MVESVYPVPVPVAYTIRVLAACKMCPRPVR